MPDSTPAGTRAVLMSLGGLLMRLGAPLFEIVTAPRGLDVSLASVAILDVSDSRSTGAYPNADVLLVVGPVDTRVMESVTIDGSTAHVLFVRAHAVTGELRSFADRAGVSLVGVDARIPWEIAYASVAGLVTAVRDDFDADIRDLYELTESLARVTGGVAAIEDETCHNLAYSSNSQFADPIWKQSILRRIAPADNSALLHEWRVFDALSRHDDVIDVPRDRATGRNRRLAVRIADAEEWMGAVWLQELPDVPLSLDATEVLAASAQLARRVIERTRNHWTSLRREVDGSLGLSPLSVTSFQSLSERLGSRLYEPALVIGVGAVRAVARRVDGGPADAAPPENVVALRAASIWPGSLTVSSGRRTYIVLVGLRGAGEDAAGHESRARRLVDVLDARDATPCVAAIGSVAPSFLELAGTREVVDRALDVLEVRDTVIAATVDDLAQRIAIDALLRHLDGDPLWRDSRVQGLIDYDREHSSELCGTLLAYLESFGDVSAIARERHLHGNTVRYRLKRAADLSGIDLDDPIDRVTVLLQLWRRRGQIR